MDSTPAESNSAVCYGSSTGSGSSVDLRFRTAADEEFLLNMINESSGLEISECIDENNNWIPLCDDSKKPFVNQSFNDVDSAFDFYKEYGRIGGFDVKRSSHKVDRHGKVSIKYFLCSSSGYSEASKARGNAKVVIEGCETEESYTTAESSRKVRRISSTRCGCRAKVTVHYSSPGLYQITEFIEGHNHKLVTGDSRQFLRASRNLSSSHKRFIIDANKNNMGASKAHSIFKSMTGSYESVGATQVDFKNFERDIKKYIGQHDAEMIIQKFSDKAETSENSFQFQYQTDEDGHLTRIFWTDAIGMKNYTSYGDVVSFDATYRTNKYNMVFVPLVGIDNHWKTTTFASALLDKEDFGNFSWLCEVFLQMMGKAPKCIVTDQCAAMGKAIPIWFPDAKHRLCMWHIMKKFPSKIGSLFCADSDFLSELNKFVWSNHTSPKEFEDGWCAVVEQFGLSDNVWLSEMYELRSSWIPAYFRDEEMAGLLRTTSRSESSNFFFNHYLEKGDTLSEFYLCYESAIDKQRHVNAKMNKFDIGTPHFVTPKDIEKHAADVYTRSVFYKVQGQIKASCYDIEFDNVVSSDGVKTFYIRDNKVKGKIFEVEFTYETENVKCSCQLYTRIGFLCKHCFWCLCMCGVHKIPRQYIKNRWMKNAEDRHSILRLGEVNEQCSKEERIRSKSTDAWFLFQSCVTDAGSDEVMLDLILEKIKELHGVVQQNREKGKSKRINDDIIEDLVGSKKCPTVKILPPNKSNNKGSRKRITTAIEKSIAGKKRKKRMCKTCKVLSWHDSRNCDGVAVVDDKCAENEQVVEC